MMTESGALKKLMKQYISVELSRLYTLGKTEFTIGPVSTR